MRIISGKYKGLKLNGFDIGGTRPTMDRVKESLFGMIFPYLEDSIVLDLYAGSGSLGIEALSNGCKKAYFVDNNPISIKTIKENLKTIKEEYETLNMNYSKALDILKDKEKFDIIFLDPPYDKNLITPSIEKLIENNLLNEGALIICEYENEDIKCNLQLIKEKKYGLKHIKIFKI